MQFKNIIVAVTAAVSVVFAANNSSSSAGSGANAVQLGVAGTVGAVAAGAVALLI